MLRITELLKYRQRLHEDSLKTYERYAKMDNTEISRMAQDDIKKTIAVIEEIEFLIDTFKEYEQAYINEN